MSLRNGTSTTAPKSGRPKKVALKSEDICSIIKQCAESHVAKLKFGDLELDFGSAQLTALPQAPLDTEISEGTLQKEEKDYLAERELESKEDEASLMLIEDPAKFESLLEQGEFDADESTVGSE